MWKKILADGALSPLQRLQRLGALGMGTGVGCGVRVGSAGARGRAFVTTTDPAPTQGEALFQTRYNSAAAAVAHLDATASAEGLHESVEALEARLSDSQAPVWADASAAARLSQECVHACVCVQTRLSALRTPSNI